MIVAARTATAQRKRKLYGEDESATVWISQNTQKGSQTEPLAQATPELGVLKGRWVRRDGGYTIVIKSVDPSGTIDATYSNPKPIGVSKAEASTESGALNVFLELRGQGYPGSTYTLTYDPKSDCLLGIYFHAVLQQNFGVIFQRVK